MKEIQDIKINNCNCIESTLCRLLFNNNNNNYSMLFLNTWNLNYNTNENIIYKRYNVYDNFKELYFCLNKYYGIKLIEKRIIFNEDELSKFINDHEFILVQLKSKKSNWSQLIQLSTYYLEIGHLAFLQSFDKNGIFYLDDFGIKYLKYDDINTEDCLLKFVHKYKSPFNIEYRLNELLNILEELLIYKKPFKAMENLANEFIDPNFILNDLNKCSNDIIVSPLLGLINDIARSKYNFFRIIDDMDADGIIKFDYKKIKLDVEKIISEWLLINKLIIKYYYKNNITILTNISDYIKNLSLKEEMIAKILYENLSRK